MPAFSQAFPKWQMVSLVDKRVQMSNGVNLLSPILSP